MEGQKNYAAALALVFESFVFGLLTTLAAANMGAPFGLQIATCHIGGYKMGNALASVVIVNFQVHISNGMKEFVMRQ